jgi:uroporphyrinogen-III synthase
VSALVAIVGPLAAIRTTFCAIGETTAAAARDAGAARVAVAPTPTPEGIARAVRSVYPVST